MISQCGFGRFLLEISRCNSKWWIRRNYSLTRPVEKFIEYYEEVIGLTDVKKAQAEVIEVHSHV